MLRRCAFLRRGRRGGGSRIPKAYANVQASAAGSAWGKIGRYTDEAREDALHGAWRSAHETVIRDATLAPPDTSPHSSATEEEDDKSANTHNTLSFPTAEDADVFMKALHESLEAERHVPVMELTRNFYNELAKTADEEIDAESTEPQEDKTDEQRADEAAEIQRQFFADFYIAQNFLQEHQRQEFLRAMTTAPESFFVADPSMVLSRTVVRHELERWAARGTHETIAIAPVDWMDGAFVVRPHNTPPPADDTTSSMLLGELNVGPVVAIADSMSKNLQERDSAPSESSDAIAGAVPTVADPQEVSSHAATLLDADTLANILEETTPLHDVSSVSPPKVLLATDALDADVLASLLTDVEPLHENVLVDEVATLASSSHGGDVPPALECNATETAMALTSPSPLTPQSVDLTLLEMQWLQRKISSGSLVDTDLLGLILPLLLVGDVVDQQGTGGQQQPRNLTIATTVKSGERVGNGNAGGDYMLDVQRFLQHEEWMSSQSEKDSMKLMDYTLLTLHRPHDGLKRRGGGGAKQYTTDDDGVNELLSSDSAVAPQMKSTHSFFHQVEQRSIHTIDVLLPHRDHKLPRELLVDAVLCCPRCSGDGLRPRVVLSSDVNAEGRTAANRAFDVVRLAAEKGAASILDELLYCMRLLPPSPLTQPAQDETASLSHPRVVFAVNSMNPMECEAVVCAALERVRQEGKRFSIIHPSKILLPSNMADAALVGGTLSAGWGRGLTEWVAAEGAPSFCDCETLRLETRQEVAAAAWRLHPLEGQCNGSFVVVLERTDCGAHSPQHPNSGQVTKIAQDFSRRRVAVKSVSNNGTYEDCAFSPHTLAVRSLAWNHPGYVVQGGAPLYLKNRSGCIDFRWSGSADAIDLVRSDVTSVHGVQEVSSVLLLALLYVRSANASMLTAACNSAAWRTRQPATTPAEQDAHATLKAVHDRVLKCLSLPHEASLWLTPRIPQSVLVDRQLHASLHSELELLFLVAHVQRSSTQQEDHGEWTLRLQAAGPTDVLVEERLVSVRDSLCFLHRALGLPYQRDDVLKAMSLPLSLGDSPSAPQPLRRTTDQPRRHKHYSSPMERGHNHKIRMLTRKLTLAGGDVPSDGPSSWRRQT